MKSVDQKYQLKWICRNRKKINLFHLTKTGFTKTDFTKGT